MDGEKNISGSLRYSEVTAENLDSFQDLMKQKGCWCMYWRMSESDFHAMPSEGRKEQMLQIIRAGEVPGILALDGDKPVGWCSISPRTSFGRLNSSKALRKVDDKPVWSIVCFYIDRKYRRMGVTSGLIQEAVRYAARNGASIVEAYPLDVKGQYPYTSAAYTGFLSTFLRAGFVVVERRSQKRPIVRYFIKHEESASH